ncbi:MAG: DUF433 domain-containing protein [Moorea sp. SIO2B7]|nr:DUF433 domain-containing protein [Moorena sp. SIO2B7]
MELKEYFDFLAANDIRVKGTRVGIESILYEYIHRKLSPEEIEPKFRTVNLEQVYATILYYLHNRETVGKYFADWLEWEHKQRKKQEMNPDPVILRLRERIAKYGRDPEVHKALRRQLQMAAKENIKEEAKKSQ